MKKVLVMILTLCTLLSLCLTACIRVPQNGYPPVDSSTVEDSSIPEEPDDSSSSSPNIPDEPPQEERDLRVLFFGNSLMFFNDMPSLFKNLAEKSGKTIYVDSVTRGSATISDFANSTTDVGSKAYPKLLNEKWDYVIIEPSRRITPYENTVYEAELAAAKVIQRMATNAGAEILLYCVWGNNDGTLTQYNAANPIAMTKGTVHYCSRTDHVKFLKKVNEEFSEELGGVGIIDAGYAFENSMETYPAINLYDSDLRHPSLEGSYLAAACVYATIYNQSPENIGFTGGTTLYFEMQRMAKVTVIDGVVPKMEDTPVVVERVDDPTLYDVLVIGTDLINNYDLVTPLMGMIEETQNLGLHLTYLTDSIGVFNKLKDATADFGLRDALARRKYDAVVLQVSRRCTPSATDVIASELNALKAVYPVITENCDNVYLFTFNGQSKPSIFTTTGGVVSYTKTDAKESATAAEMSAFYDELATSWANEVGCGVIPQGTIWDSLAPASDAAKGYVRACCLYTAFFKEEAPATDTNGVDEQTAANIRSKVYNAMFGTPEVPEELPEYDTFDVLIIGSNLIGNTDATTAFASMVDVGQDKELHLHYVTNGTGVMNKLANKDESDDFYANFTSALKERKWDAVIIQISRRITPGSSVETAEFEALEEIYPLISANCSNIYLSSIIASANPAIFSATGMEYTKTSFTVSATLTQMNEYFAELGLDWANKLGCEFIDQGRAWELANPSTSATKGYVRACSYYNSIFGVKVPQGVDTNGVDADVATAIAKAVANYCLEHVPADLTQLNAVIELANQKVEDDFTPNSWATFIELLNQAKTYDTTADQDEVDAMVTNLTKAMNELVVKADFTALNSAIAQAGEKVQANYTQDSWAKLQTALDVANALDANATQDAVNSALEALNKALNELVVKADLTALNEAIATAQSKDSSLYTVATWTVLESALAHAQTITEESSTEAVASATVALNEAIAGLVLKADLTALNKAISDAGELSADGYTQASWQILQDALTAAQGLTVESAQADVDSATEAINNAITTLEPVSTLPEYDTYDVLVLGSDLMSDEYLVESLASMVVNGQGKELYYHLVSDSTGVINKFATCAEPDNEDDIYYGMRNALAERRWDAIIIQFSRRCTPGSTATQAELDALKLIYPLLTANTDNIYIFTFNGSANPDVFTADGTPAYTKTGETYTATATEMALFYQETVEAWGEELGCKGIFYGSAYVDMSPSTSKSKGFMRALCMYYAIFGEEMPDGTNTQGTSSSGITKIKNAAAKYCLNVD